MKKLVLACFIIGLFCGNAFAVAVDLAAPTITPSSKDNTLVTYTYVIPTVAGGESGYFKFRADGVYGAIKQIYIFSASEDLDILVNQVDIANALPTNDTVLHMTGMNLMYSPSLEMPRIYTNGDTPSSSHLYLVVKNDGAIAVGASAVMVIVYRRY